MKKLLLFKQNYKFFLIALLLEIPLFVSAIGYFPDESFSKSIETPVSGKVKFREDWVYKLYNGKVASAGVKIGYESYDKQGQKIEEANFTKDGMPLLEVTYTYDDWGREAQCLGSKLATNFFTKWEYSFDEKSRTLVKKIYKSTSDKERTIYIFNEKGNISEEINFDKEGGINYHYKITYTSFNKPLELVEMDGNGDTYQKWVYEYNENRQNVEVKQFDATLDLYKKYKNIFDANGTQKEVHTFDKEGNEVEKTISVYQYY